ncbi:MAG: glycosyltransferase, partial [Bdellovibrionales bacterium]|nr:glycosyltransferase [Bdellovibrionales bacterium]
MGFVARNYDQPGFGVSTVVRNLYRALQESERSEQHFFFSDQLHNDLYPEKLVHVSPLAKSSFSKLWWDHVSLSAKCRRYQIDTVLFPYHVRSLFLGCHSVVIIHDLMYHLFPNDWSDLERAYMQLGTEYSLREADAIIVPSQSTAQDIRRLFPQSACKLHVIPWGISENFSPQSMDKKMETFRSCDIAKDFVLVIGSDHPRKNTRVALEIFKSVQHLIPHDFVFVGPSFGIDTTWKAISAPRELRER